MYNLKEIMIEVNKRNLAELEDPPRHHFSRQSRKRLNDILYPKIPKIEKSKIPPRKMLLYLVMAIILLVVGTTAGAAIANGFLRKEHSDNTELFTPVDSNCPITIESVYYLPEIPEGYKLYETISDNREVYTSYMNQNTGRCMVFCQSVKHGYRSSADNEHHSLEEVDINGHYGLYLGDNDGGSVFWDNDDYILEVSGDFDKDELLNLAKSAKIREF